MIRQRFISILAVAIALALIPAIALAERVTYSFKAVWTPPNVLVPDDSGVPPAVGELTMFNVSRIPRDASVTGTFTYDPSTVGTGSGPTIYSQSIQAGFTLDIGRKLHLSAEDFVVRISNDFQSSAPPPGGTFDVFGVIFDSKSAPLTPLIVNGVPWAGTARNYINLRLLYSEDTLPDTALPNEPPDDFLTGFSYSFLGDDPGNNGPFMVTSVVPTIPGDYNVDGIVSAYDFGEWQQAFGCSGLACGPADGNHDGFVDGADYVVWRRAAATSAGSGASITHDSAVPEPAALFLSFPLWVGCASVWRGQRRRLRGR